MGEEYVDLWAYNIETVLAEKIETILSKAELNGRMRDFYDVYLIYTKNFKNINIDHFRKDIEKTFSKREYVGNPIVTMDLLKDSKMLRTRWRIYQRKYDYAQDINFDDILDCIEKMIEQIELIEI